MTLLVAGPAGVDAQGLIAGSGLLAAVAAAPLASVQLWSRTGTFSQPVRELLARRGLDLSGVDFSGAVTVVSSDGALPAGSGHPLGGFEPTSADGLTAVLIIGLDPLATQQALRCARALQAPIVICAHAPELDLALPGAAPAEPASHLCDLRIESLAEAMRLTGTQDVLAAAHALQAAGAKAAVVTAGALGGLLVYGDRAVSYPVQPVVREHAGSGVAAAFAGALAGWCAGAGADFTALKRGCATASVVAGILAAGGPKRLLAADRAQYLERFNRLRRIAKY
jgi:sugar/nucleoside kinase (ribokinase family)